MSRLAAGFACRFFTFWREVLSDSLTVSPSARNQMADSCGRPLAPTVPSTATCASSRSRWVSGIVAITKTLTAQPLQLPEPLHIRERRLVAGLRPTSIGSPHPLHRGLICIVDREYRLTSGD